MIEATAKALAIARIIEPHVQRVVLANPKTVRESSRRAKTDQIDARVLAQLLAVGFLDAVWIPDEKAGTRRRLISRRCALVRPAHATRIRCMRCCSATCSSVRRSATCSACVGVAG